VKFLLTVRRFEEKDINKDCPFTPDTDDLTIYLEALTEDIQVIGGVNRVVRNECVFDIELENLIDKNKLLELLKPYFFNERACQYKYVSLDEITE
jgi:hypothetical protein